MDGGKIGKIIAGCSGCLMVLLLMCLVGFSLFASSTSNVSGDEAMLGQSALSACCCFAGVGLIGGVVMLMVAGKKDE